MVFLTVDNAMQVHSRALRQDGGLPGIRSAELLESALAAPQSSMFGTLLHPDLPSQAAAYLFHLSRNHPFVDGNKRTALACTLLFLRLNGMQPIPVAEAYALTLHTATGVLNKAQITAIIAGYQTPNPPAQPLVASEDLLDEDALWMAVDITAGQHVAQKDIPRLRRLVEGLRPIFAEYGIAELVFDRPGAKIHLDDSGLCMVANIEMVLIPPDFRPQLGALFGISDVRRVAIDALPQTALQEGLMGRVADVMVLAGIRTLEAGAKTATAGWMVEDGVLHTQFRMQNFKVVIMSETTRQMHMTGRRLTDA